MSQIWAILTASALLFTFGANEVSHGGVAETVGVGHHHMADHGGYHCADHDDPEHLQAHQEHMHGQPANSTWNTTYGAGHHHHASCYPSGGVMHDQHAQDHHDQAHGPHGGQR